MTTLWAVGGVLLGTALGRHLADLAAWRKCRRLLAALDVRIVNTTPPTTAEIGSTP